MNWGISFFINSILLGVGLAMDAFSVSLANGLNEPHMKKPKMCLIAGVFGFFQALMPMIGWVCVHTIVQYFRFQIIMPLIGWFCVHTIAEAFEAFQKFIPWIALLLLSYIGGKMLIEGIRAKGEELEKTEVGFGALIVQGIATSIDALSVGFTIAE